MPQPSSPEQLSPLDILNRLTKPKTAEEVRAFILKRHGEHRGNASSDLAALDSTGLNVLKTRHSQTD
jgi:hypothetical protein